MFFCKKFSPSDQVWILPVLSFACIKESRWVCRDFVWVWDIFNKKLMSMGKSFEQSMSMGDQRSNHLHTHRYRSKPIEFVHTHCNTINTHSYLSMPIHKSTMLIDKSAIPIDFAYVKQLQPMLRFSIECNNIKTSVFLTTQAVF